MLDIETRVGTDAAFDAAYREHYWAVTRYVARRWGMGDDEVRDVVADVFATAWRRRSGMPDPALPWLYAVARRTLANHRRSLDRRRSLLQRLYERHEHPEQLEDAPPPGGGSGAPHPVLSALHRLSDADQEVLRLAEWERLSTDDLAGTLGCSRSAAAMRLSRARGRLAEQLCQQPAHPSAPTSQRPHPATHR